MSGTASKDLRALHRLLLSLGYTLARENTHLVYHHPRQAPLTLAKTPGDWRTRANELAEIRRRHPAALKRRKSDRTRPRGQRPSEARRRVVAKAKIRAEVRRMERIHRERMAAMPEPREPVDRPQCIECGRPWLSDLDPTFRSCPTCGGEIAVPPSEEAA